MYLRQYILEFMCVSSVLLKSDPYPSARVSKKVMYMYTEGGVVTLQIIRPFSNHEKRSLILGSGTYAYIKNIVLITLQKKPDKMNIVITISFTAHYQKHSSTVSTSHFFQFPGRKSIKRSTSTFQS
jgi:hypothetical protein